MEPTQNEIHLYEDRSKLYNSSMLQGKKKVTLGQIFESRLREKKPTSYTSVLLKAELIMAVLHPLLYSGHVLQKKRNIPLGSGNSIKMWFFPQDWKPKFADAEHIPSITQALTLVISQFPSICLWPLCCFKHREVPSAIIHYGLHWNSPVWFVPFTVGVLPIQLNCRGKIKKSIYLKSYFQLFSQAAVQTNANMRERVKQLTFSPQLTKPPPSSRLFLIEARGQWSCSQLHRFTLKYFNATYIYVSRNT